MIRQYYSDSRYEVHLRWADRPGFRSVWYEGVIYPVLHNLPGLFSVQLNSHWVTKHSSIELLVVVWSFYYCTFQSIPVWSDSTLLSLFMFVYLSVCLNCVLNLYLLRLFVPCIHARNDICDIRDTCMCMWYGVDRTSKAGPQMCTYSTVYGFLRRIWRWGSRYEYECGSGSGLWTGISPCRVHCVCIEVVLFFSRCYLCLALWFWGCRSCFGPVLALPCFSLP